MTYSATDQEAIVLNAAWGMINDMVNHAMFVPLGQKTQDTNLIPQSSDTLRLFNILLGDFLSPLAARKNDKLPFDLIRPPPTSARVSDFTFLYYLKQVAANPQLNSDAVAIQKPLEDFSTWLECESRVERVWFPSISVEVDLSIQRREWIRICGDIGKHSFTRLEANVAKISRILSANGNEIDEGMGYTVLPEFWDWFHTNLFAYHASTIAEFLNEIRWGIYEYLKPEFTRSFHRVDPEPMYSYHVPISIVHPLGRSMYWDLMNLCRSDPWFPQFTVTRYLKLRY